MTNKDYDNIFREFSSAIQNLIPILLNIQEKYGYISEEAVAKTSQFLKISENQIYGVATFYPKFRFDEPGTKIIKVCMGTACHVLGGKFLADTIGWKLGLSIGQTSSDKKFDFQRATCLGCCTLGPVVQINGDIQSRMQVTRLMEILEENE